MTILLVIVGGLALLAVLNLLLFRGDYTVASSTVIDKPAADIYATVLDLRSWPHWSPWLLHEADCTLEYSSTPAVTAVGGNYTWNGVKVGSGKMTHVATKENENIVQRIEFVKPFKSTSKVTWDFMPAGDGTKVTWGMAGTMPFLLRFMTAKIPGCIGSNYACGLQLLKQHVDKDAPRMVLTFHGVSRQAAIRCVGHDFKGDMEEFKRTCGEHFPKMFQEAMDENGNIPGTALNVTRKFDMGSKAITSILAVPTTKDAVENYRIFEVPGGLYAKTTLQGDYMLLEHAWHSAFSNLRMNKLKMDKSRDPYEVYDTDPRQVKDPNDYLTSIYIPVKR